MRSTKNLIAETWVIIAVSLLIAAIPTTVLMLIAGMSLFTVLHCLCIASMLGCSVACFISTLYLMGFR